MDDSVPTTDALLAEIADLRAQLKDLQQHQRDLVSFNLLAVMTHDLRTPLSAVIGYSAMLQEKAEALPDPSFATEAGYIQQAAQHLLELLNDLLDLARLEAGKM